MDEKVYILVAGVNGAGKSTFYHSGYNVEDFFDFCDSSTFQNLQRVNADEILREFGDWRNQREAIAAVRIAITKIKEHLENGISFCQETTLCGHSIIKNIDVAKSKGYKIGIIYIGLDDVNLAKARVKYRVMNGGHGIDEKDIERRYSNSLRNLNSVISKCDGILFYDNTSVFRSVAVYDGKKIQFTNEINQIPNWFKEYIDSSYISSSKEVSHRAPAANPTPIKSPKETKIPER